MVTPDGMDDSIREGVICTDSDDRPLMVTPIHAARRLGLCCRLVGVLVFDTRKRLWIRRRHDAGTPFFGLWHVSTSDFVRTGEAREDVAKRRFEALFPNPAPQSGLDAWLACRPLRLWQASSRIPGCERLQVTLYRAPDVPETLLMRQHGNADQMLLSMQELDGLVNQAPELFSPVLRWLAGLHHDAESKRDS